METSRMEEEQAVKGEEGELGRREMSPEMKRSRRPCTRMRGSGLLGQHHASSDVITPGPTHRPRLRGSQRQNKRSKVNNKKIKIYPLEMDHIYSKVLYTPDTYSQSQEPSPSSCCGLRAKHSHSHSTEKKKQPNTVDRKVGKDQLVLRRSEVKQKEEEEEGGSSIITDQVKMDRSETLQTETLTPGPESERDTVKRKRRLNCRTCAACLREDCGKCVFCLDMKKFGGQHTKKQRCQFRMCLVVETSRNLKQSRPRPLDSVQADEVSTTTTTTMANTATKPQCRQRRRQRDEKTEEDGSGFTFIHPAAPPSLHPQLLRLKEEEEEVEIDKYRRVGEVEEEEWSEGVTERGTYYEIEVELPVSDSDEDTPPSLCSNLTHDDVTTNGPGEVTEPDIIYEPQDCISLSSGVFSQLEGTVSDDVMGRWGLVQLLQALRRTVLPPHWACVLADGPVLQLLQCSRLSSMADTIVHIQPDRCFYVTVQSRPLPDTHTLYRTHTQRIVHHGQVVCLLSELEPLIVCRGSRVRSSACQQEQRSAACRQLLALPFLSCLPCVQEEERNEADEGLVTADDI